MPQLFALDEKVIFRKTGNDVLAIGELLVDMITTDEEEITTYRQFFGGAPANIAVNVKRLGIKSLIASAVGEDSMGDFLINHLIENEIDTRLVQRVKSATSMVLLNKSTGTPIPIFYRDADFSLTFEKALKDAVMESKIVHFSCWPISRMPSRHVIEEAIKVAKKNDVLICFDPNYHEMIWQKDEDGIQYVKSIISKSDIIKPSEDDAQRIFGADTASNQIKKFLDLGAKLVVMTLGEAGLIVSNGVETFKCTTLATEVVDTTGAGDAFWAGFYTALIKGYPIKEAIIFGNAASAYKLKYIGAIVNLPKLEELKELIK